MADDLTGEEFVNCLGERWRVIVQLAIIENDNDPQYLCRYSSGTEVSPAYASEIQRMQQTFGR